MKPAFASSRDWSRHAGEPTLCGYTAREILDLEAERVALRRRLGLYRGALKAIEDMANTTGIRVAKHRATKALNGEA